METRLSDEGIEDLEDIIMAIGDDVINQIIVFLIEDESEPVYLKPALKRIKSPEKDAWYLCFYTYNEENTYNDIVILKPCCLPYFLFLLKFYLDEIDNKEINIKEKGMQIALLANEIYEAMTTGYKQ
jgi:hypothetical protein